MRNRADPLFVLFFVSGFSGLIYESAWSHYVKLFLGHAAYAQTLVLVIFIGGLALGSWLCARWANRIANPLRAYALIEGAIGVAALVFHAVFVWTTDWAYASLLPAACEPASPFCAGQWALSALLLAPQSVLLGATFPLMSSAVIRLREAQPGHDIATLYFLNSLGAVMGVLASAFVLLPLAGLPGTLQVAGVANLLIAAAAWFLARSAPGAPVRNTSEEGEAPNWDWASPRLTRLLLWTALLTGLSSFVYEIAWIRMLSLVLGASTHAFELMLASFILGLALGGLWVRHRVDPSRDPIRFLGLVQLVMGVAAAATIPIYGASFDLMAWMLDSLSRNPGGFVLFNLGSTVIALLVMLPATFCAGMTLPLITYRLLRSPAGERSLGLVYSVNTLGAILGVILAVHVLMEWLGLKGTVLVGAAIDVALGAALLAAAGGRGGLRTRAVAMPAVAAVASLALFWAVFDIDLRKAAGGVFRSGAARIGTEDRVIYHRDGKTATVDVIEHKTSRAIRTNGKADAGIGTGTVVVGDEHTMALLAMLPLGHRPDARKAAVIGFGSGMSTATLLASSRLERVDTIEIEPAMIEGARHFLPRVEAAYTDPRSRIVIDDAKSYFARGRERYDIIVSEPSNPWVSGVASLFTEEFYRRLDGYMNDGAVLAQWLHTYEMDAPTLASILGAVSKTFPDFAIYTSIDTDIVLIARKGGAAGAFDPGALQGAGFAPHLERLKITPEAVASRRLVGHWRTLGPYFRGTYPITANSDYHPVVEQRASRARFTRESVTDLVELMRAPVPLLEMLDHRVPPPPTRLQTSRVATPDGLTAAAWEAHDVLLRPSGPESSLSQPHEVAAQLARQWTSCRGEVSYRQVFPYLLSLAGTVNPGLHPDVASAFWARIAESPCARALERGDADWIALFAAVATRNPAQIRPVAARVLEASQGVRNAATEYALMAAVAAAIQQGESQAAMKLLEQAPSRWLAPGRPRRELGYLFSLAASAPAR